MDVVEAVLSRKSIRAFKPDPVPGKVLEEILEAAVRAPSWANTQPWELAVVGGEKLLELKLALAAVVDEAPRPDIPRIPDFPEPYGSRRRILGRKVMELKGIAREDQEKRRWWHLQMVTFFDAPGVVLLCGDSSFYRMKDFFNGWALFSCGSLAMNITLLAANRGLGTCCEVAPVGYPDVIRRVLDISDSKLMVLAIAVGYPDWEEPVNQIRSDREALETITTWYGFPE